MKTRDMTETALAAAMIAACSWLSIPAPVPFTLQTFAVFCALFLLGWKKGGAALLLYVLLGAFGLPVFAGFRGGINVLLGPTGGYIIGFLFCPLVFMLGGNKLPQAAEAAAGNILCYVFGTLWFSRVYGVGFWAACLTCVVPYVIPDGVKIALALVLCRRLKKLKR